MLTPPLPRSSGLRRRRRGRSSSSPATFTGATVLDIGGGLGAIELELLAAGAARATVVELSGGTRRRREAASPSAGSATASSGGSATSSRRPTRRAARRRRPASRRLLLPRCRRARRRCGGARARRIVLTYPQERWLTRFGVRGRSTSACASRAAVSAVCPSGRRGSPSRAERQGLELGRRGAAGSDLGERRVRAVTGRCSRERVTHGTRHQDLDADEPSPKSEPDGAENELGPDEDDTGYDDELEDEIDDED